MSDPLGLISNINSNSPLQNLKSGTDANRATNDTAGIPSFKDMMMNQLQEVNRLQEEASEATMDLQTGKRTDFDGVIIAAEKADMAFQMLLQVRNKMIDAYNEVKQIRV